MDINILRGCILVGVDGEIKDTEVIFQTDFGARYKMYHEQD